MSVRMASHQALFPSKCIILCIRVFMHQSLCRTSPFPVFCLVKRRSVRVLLRPVADKLVPALSGIFKAPTTGELSKKLATSLLAEYAADDLTAFLSG